MMYKRMLYGILLGAMLAMVANLMPSSDAQAMGTACLCPGGECSCCCKQDAAEGLAPVSQSLDTSASGHCSCSTGPNPFGTGETQKQAYIDPSKERLFQPVVVFISAAFHPPAGLPANRHKPPAVSSQRLYLLNSSFRI
jgi:hypothetical protein